MDAKAALRFNRRELFKYGGAALIGSAAVDLSTPAAGQGTSTMCDFKADASQVDQAPCAGQPVQIEFMPTSPFIVGALDRTTNRLTPFIDSLAVPIPLAPTDTNAWVGPLPSRDKQSSLGGSHSLTPSEVMTADKKPLPDPLKAADPGNPDPLEKFKLKYDIRVRNGTHKWTSSRVLPIDALGQTVVHPVTRIPGETSLPLTAIWGFNGQFPGPMI